MRIILATCLCVLFLPAAAADDTMHAEGAALYTDLCLECHGPTATEGESGDIRGLSAATIMNAVQGFEMMPSFDIDADEAKAVAAYLAGL